MNKKMIYIGIVACALASLGATNVLANDSREYKGAGEEHRSKVAEVVKKMEKTAGMDLKIRDEVKTVAQEEKNSSEVIKEKMDMVEKRSGFKTFLTGSDYKNLGDLRSELVTTQNRLDRLNKALDRATSTTIKADLEAQIKELEAIKTKADTFVKDNENKFSLFGWLVRMFR